MPKIYTHVRPDLDAHSSCWAVRRFISLMEDAEIVYVKANWDGFGMESGDMAVDMHANGRGIKGVQDFDGTVHSCFSYIVSNYASREDANYIKDLVRFIDIQDAHGSVVNHLIKYASYDARRIFALNNIGAVMRAIEYKYPDEPKKVFELMSGIFDGYLLMGRANVCAIEEASRMELFADGRVALVRDKRYSRTDHILWERGVLAIVYVDGFNLGVLRRGGSGFSLRDGSDFRADHPKIREVVERSGDTSWFAHSKGFLYCRGSRKAPAETSSNVDPQELIKVISNLLK